MRTGARVCARDADAGSQRACPSECSSRRVRSPIAPPCTAQSSAVVQRGPSRGTVPQSRVELHLVVNPRTPEQKLTAAIQSTEQLAWIIDYAAAYGRGETAREHVTEDLNGRAPTSADALMATSLTSRFSFHCTLQFQFLSHSLSSLPQPWPSNCSPQISAPSLSAHGSRSSRRSVEEPIQRSQQWENRTE